MVRTANFSAQGGVGSCKKKFEVGIRGAFFTPLFGQTKSGRKKQTKCFSHSGVVKTALLPALTHAMCVFLIQGCFPTHTRPVKNNGPLPPLSFGKGSGVK